jgi:hypothetical protein
MPDSYIGNGRQEIHAADCYRTHLQERRLLYGLYTPIEHCEFHFEKCEIVSIDVDSRYREIEDGEVGWARPRAHFKGRSRITVVPYDMEVAETIGGVGKNACMYIEQ